MLQAPTTDGQSYFKATSPLTIHEPALLLALSDWYPEYVPTLLPVDLKLGWMLMQDAGQALSELIRPSKNVDLWLQVLARYAELQIEMAGRVPELHALGVPNWCLSVLPHLYDQLLTDRDTLRIDRFPALTSAQIQRLLDLSPRVVELCDDLASHRIPETLNHGDFHDANILVNDGRFIVLDWGESCVAHPFYSLRIPLVIARNVFAEIDGAADMVRDAYLEPWTRYESRAELLAAVDAASRLANINDALIWHRSVSRLQGALTEEYADPVRLCFRSSSTPRRHLPNRIMPLIANAKRALRSIIRSPGKYLGRRLPATQCRLDLLRHCQGDIFSPGLSHNLHPGREPLGRRPSAHRHTWPASQAKGQGVGTQDVNGLAVPWCHDWSRRTQQRIIASMKFSIAVRNRFQSSISWPRS